ncbi:hypothetical protein SPRG_13050 [Saprolegnia parasitica CBS 223.65]|uniref:Uncharacterized protein n=1 Tax=Saprolegnia parasitica (strain CBS 223.65) TaxID=695850 RepID=A0A067BN63_SAPPC|nr:hypothetical protein SPRG_13050 [Saprolegnia parasitica CBS 223.65]KDO19944.1 hypothetical protein SPRG_13050 [Saprolegnia parasitica CBS 223.65]|eukprot:XP_012209316.1 hypothetical protein SPRG_13050 [Saprolegnia parasitica CBS 223.65]
MTDFAAKVNIETPTRAPWTLDAFADAISGLKNIVGEYCVRELVDIVKSAAQMVNKSRSHLIVGDSRCADAELPAHTCPRPCRGTAGSSGADDGGGVGRECCTCPRREPRTVPRKVR